MAYLVHTTISGVAVGEVFAWGHVSEEELEHEYQYYRDSRKYDTDFPVTLILDKEPEGRAFRNQEE